MKPSIRGWLLLAGLLLLTPLFSGCFLYALFGNITEKDGEVYGFIGAVAITTECTPSFFEEHNCTYTMIYEDGSYETKTTISLISDFGLFGVLIDPVILQVPEDVSDPSGTFTDTLTSTTQPLVISQVDSFKVQPGVEATAEPGQKFLILEFPASTAYENLEFDFDLTFHYPVVEPIDVKGIFAGRVDAGGQTFYMPLLPCTSDFAEVPEFTIPVSDTQVNLLEGLFVFLFHNPNLGCDDEVYDFTDAGPAPTPTVAPQPDALWADDDCDFDVDAVDALKNLQDIAALPYTVEPGCPPLESQQMVVPAGFGERTWGDVDCDGDLDAVDALQILRHVAALSVDQEPGCPEIAQPIRFG